MKSSVYVTTGTVGKGTGGGIVAHNESLALAKVTFLTNVLCKEQLYPPKYGLPDVPFLWDYLASHYLEDVKVDVAHFYGNPFGLTAKKLKENGAKIFVTIPAHNLELSIEEFKLLGFEYPYIHMTDPFLWKLYTMHYKLADVVICPSQTSANYIKKKLNLTSEVKVIPHGCDLPEKAEPIPEKFDVAYLGQFGPDKGVIYLIIAWSQLNLPEATLILAGGDQQTVINLLNLASAQGKYHIPGYVPDVSEIYNKCTVYVQPSVTEGFGIEVLEAMAHGRPVIVTEGCGASELVEDGREGFVVPIRDPKAIADKILYFCENPSEAKRMGLDARKKAEQFTWDKIRRQYEELYVASI